MKFGVCCLRLCGSESPICAFEEECAGADQGDQLTRAGTSTAVLICVFRENSTERPLPQARYRRRLGATQSGGKEPAVAEQCSKSA